MSKIIPSHGSPSGSVFGIIGNLIGTDEGSPYIKYEYDALNIGWGSPSETPPSPSTTPTPTPTNLPPQLFSTTWIYASGSSKCNNESRLEWITYGTVSLSYRVSWNRNATQSDPVLVMGTATSSSLMDNSTEYNGSIYLASPGKYWLSFSRPSRTIDNVQFTVNLGNEGGVIRAARLTAYTSGSNTVGLLAAERISGQYIYHIRNLSGNLLNGSGGTIQVGSSTSQTISVSGVDSVETVELLEIVSDTEPLYFTPREFKLCPTQTPTPTSTPTVTPTPTVTTSITPTSTPTNNGPLPSGTQTPTPTPSITPTNTPTNTTTPTPTPTPTTRATEAVWIDYDAYGRFQATWIDASGNFNDTELNTGPEFTTALSGQTIAANSLSIKYGANIRYAAVGSPDPRGVSYQIDAVTNQSGLYEFDYIDPYNIQRNAAGTSTPSTPVYGVVCGRSVVTSVKGSAQISTRRC